MTDIADKETPDIAATTAIGRGVNSFCLPHHVEQSRSSAKANCAFTLLLRQTILHGPFELVLMGVYCVF